MTSRCAEDLPNPEPQHLPEGASLSMSEDRDPTDAPSTKDRNASPERAENQNSSEASDSGDAAPLISVDPRSSAASPHSAKLVVLTQMLGDIQSVRIANENRLRSLPESFAFDAQFIRDQVTQTKAQEKTIVRELERSMKAHPLGDWVKRNLGLGFKTCGRLIGILGDVYMNPLTEKPRTLGQLNAYCGLHVVDGAAPRLKSGVRCNWNTIIKSLLWVMADCAMKSPGSPFREVYLERRKRTETTHPDWPKWKSHKDGLRITSKAILKSLWLEARRLNEGASEGDTENQRLRDAPSTIGLNEGASSFVPEDPSDRDAPSTISKGGNS